jgi:hypothetical protein
MGNDGLADRRVRPHVRLIRGDAACWNGMERAGEQGGPWPRPLPVATLPSVLPAITTVVCQRLRPRRGRAAHMFYVAVTLARQVCASGVVLGPRRRPTGRAAAVAAGPRGHPLTAERRHDVSCRLGRLVRAWHQRVAAAFFTPTQRTRVLHGAWTARDDDCVAAPPVGTSHGAASSTIYSTYSMILPRVTRDFQLRRLSTA